MPLSNFIDDKNNVITRKASEDFFYSHASFSASLKTAPPLCNSPVITQSAFCAILTSCRYEKQRSSVR